MPRPKTDSDRPLSPLARRAVLYLRVSSDEQVRGYSLDAQEASCRDWCARNAVEIDEIFRDEGESAKTANRPGLQAMLRHCRQHARRIQFIVVWSIDRWVRDRYDDAVIGRELAGLGISLRSSTQPIDETPIGGFIRATLASVAQLDNQMKAERVAASMRLALQRGQWVWRAPLGYLNACRAEGGKTLLPDPARAERVRWAFERVATGLHQQADVLREVTAMGLTTRRGLPLSMSTFQRMLGSPIYAGRISAPQWGIDSTGTWPPLVAEDTFWQVQAVLRRAEIAAPYRRRREEFPLRGLMVCDRCGRTLTGSLSRGKTGRRYPYYHCPAPAKCRHTRVRTDDLERQFLGLLESLRPQAGYLALFREVVLDVWRQKEGSVRARRQSLEARAQEVRRRRDRLDEAYLYEAAVDRDTYDRQRGRLAADLTTAELELSDARLEELDVEAVVEFAVHLATHASTLWLRSSLDQRQRLQQALFPARLRVVKGRVRTPVTSSFYEVLGVATGAGLRLVSPTGLEPVLPP